MILKAKGEADDCVAARMVKAYQDFDENEAPYTEQDMKEVIATIYGGTSSYLWVKLPRLTLSTAGSDTVCFS